MAGVHETEKVGVGHFLDAISRHPEVTKVESVEGNPAYWEQDIDFLCERTDGSTLSVEIKSEERFTGNFFLEAIGNSIKRKKGWFMFCKADWVYYYFRDKDVAYVLHLPPLFQWFKANRQALTDEGAIEYRTVGTRHNNGYSAEGWLIAIDKLMERVPELVFPYPY